MCVHVHFRCISVKRYGRLPLDVSELVVAGADHFRRQNVGDQFQIRCRSVACHPTSECALCVGGGGWHNYSQTHYCRYMAIDFKLFVRVRVLVGTLWLCRQLQQQERKWQEPK